MAHRVRDGKYREGFSPADLARDKRRAEQQMAGTLARIDKQLGLPHVLVEPEDVKISRQLSRELFSKSELGEAVVPGVERRGFGPGPFMYSRRVRVDVRTDSPERVMATAYLYASGALGKAGLRTWTDELVISMVDGSRVFIAEEGKITALPPTPENSSRFAYVEMILIHGYKEELTEEFKKAVRALESAANPLEKKYERKENMYENLPKEKRR